MRSILGQTLADFEFVIGDDGSTDGTFESLEGLARADSRIRLLRRKQSSGLASSANWVVRESRGSLIAIAHADDRSYPRRLEKQVAVFSETPEIELVGTLWDGMDEHGKIVRPANWARLLFPSAMAPFSHSSIMFRRRAFERVGGYRPEAEYWEDLDLYYRISAEGRIAVIPEVLATVRHARSSTRLRDEQGKVEDAVDLMYRSSAAQAAGKVPLGSLLQRSEVGEMRLYPLTFVSCGSTRMWAGQKLLIWRRMRARARLGANAATIKSLLWVGLGTISPRTLRFCVRAVLNLRNLFARRAVAGKPYVEWHPVANHAREPLRSAPDCA